MTARRMLLGLARLGRFRGDGMRFIEGSSAAVLASLAPLLGFALVGAALMLDRGGVRDALVDLLTTTIVLLAPLVISAALARRWDRDAGWFGFAVALNLCQWAVSLVFFLALIGAVVLEAAGLGEQPAVLAAALAVMAYGLSLHWFLARKALSLSRGRAAMLVAAINFGTGLLVLLPQLLTSRAADGAAGLSLGALMNDALGAVTVG